ESLSGWKMQPEVAEDAQSTLAKMHARATAGGSFPLVILDALMPGMDGFTLAAWIKVDPRLAGATILMLSSSDPRPRADRLEALGLGDSDDKPNGRGDLLEVTVCALKQGEEDAETMRHRQVVGQRAGSPRAARNLVVEGTSAKQNLNLNIWQKYGRTAVE